MKKIKSMPAYLLLLGILAISVIMGCGPAADTLPPTVISTIPINSYGTFDIHDNLHATFSEAMEPATIIAANFTVTDAGTPVPGTVVYNVAKKTATFAPDSLFSSSTLYTATVKVGAKDLAGNPMSANKVWTFTTAVPPVGPNPVLLKTAGDYVILAKAAIANNPTSVITGDVGISPSTLASTTGLSPVLDVGGAFALSAQVTGFIFGATMAAPTTANLTQAVLDMEDAYTDAEGRLLPDFTDVGTGGDIAGLTLVGGLYNFTTAVTITDDVTFDGGAYDVWILQIPDTLDISAAKSVILTGGARPKNIFWQVAGAVTMGADSHFEGVVLGATGVTLITGATMNGRILAQTSAVLDQNTVTEPILP